MCLCGERNRTFNDADCQKCQCLDVTNQQINQSTQFLALMYPQPSLCFEMISYIPSGTTSTPGSNWLLSIPWFFNAIAQTLNEIFLLVANWVTASATADLSFVTIFTPFAYITTSIFA